LKCLQLCVMTDRMALVLLFMANMPIFITIFFKPFIYIFDQNGDDFSLEIENIEGNYG
jgi:hypothetical protein